MTRPPPRPPWTASAMARRAAFGVAVGAAVVAATGLLLWATGTYRLDAWSPRLPPAAAVALPVFAWIEELLFRRLLLERLVRWWGRAVGLLVAAAVFALVHAANPGASIPAAIGVFLAGLWLGQLYLERRRLVACTVAHTTWNVLLGPALGFPVSGVLLGGLLSWTAVGRPLATGAAFGPEASAWSWVVFLLAIAALEFRTRRTQAVADDGGLTRPVEEPPPGERKG